MSLPENGIGLNIFQIAAEDATPEVRTIKLRALAKLPGSIIKPDAVVEPVPSSLPIPKRLPVTP